MRGKGALPGLAYFQVMSVSILVLKFRVPDLGEEEIDAPMLIAPGVKDEG